MVFRNNLKYKGFTLAEVLVTIGILSVIAALVLPPLMNQVPDTNRVMFKKAYYTLERSVHNVVNDDSNYPYTQTGTDSNGGSVMLGLNFTTATGGSGSYNKFCYFFVDQLNTISGGQTSCPTGTGVTTNIGTTSDGMTWYIYPAATQFPLNPNSFTTKILVDVNGSRPPNCSYDTTLATYTPNAVTYKACTSGVADLYIFGVRYDGRLRVGYSNDAAPTTVTDQSALNLLMSPTINSRNTATTP